YPPRIARGRRVSRGNAEKDCKLTPCGNALGATVTGCSQSFSALPVRLEDHAPYEEGPSTSDSDVAGYGCPQRVGPTQSAGPAGGPAARRHQLNGPFMRRAYRVRAAMTTTARE